MTSEQLVVAAVVIAFASERLRNTFSRPRRALTDPLLEKRELRFTSLMLALYAICVIGSVFGYFNSQSRVYFSTGVIGGVSLLLGCMIRRFSISVMSENWSVYTVAETINQVVVSGPFKYSRHPYYWSSMLELLGLAILLNSTFGVLFSLIIYFPLLVYRAFKEEKGLASKFPDEYKKYKQQIRFFI